MARTRGLTGVPRGGTGPRMGGIVTGTGVFMEAGMSPRGRFVKLCGLKWNE